MMNVECVYFTHSIVVVIHFERSNLYGKSGMILNCHDDDTDDAVRGCMIAMQRMLCFRFYSASPSLSFSLSRLLFLFRLKLM